MFVLGSAGRVKGGGLDELATITLPGEKVPRLDVLHLSADPQRR